MAVAGAVGGGSWASVETYYLGLMNCTRTGGWVTSSGTCSSPGGRSVAALKLDSGISSKVSRPYAKRLAVGNDCSHFIGGNPGNRLSAAGYTNYTWAENIGCRSGSARSAVLGSHLFFQNEKSTNGGHYVNLMNCEVRPRRDRRVGVRRTGPPGHRLLPPLPRRPTGAMSDDRLESPASPPTSSRVAWPEGKRMTSTPWRLVR